MDFALVVRHVFESRILREPGSQKLPAAHSLPAAVFHRSVIAGNDDSCRAIRSYCTSYFLIVEHHFLGLRMSLLDSHTVK